MLQKLIILTLLLCANLAWGQTSSADKYAKAEAMYAERYSLQQIDKALVLLNKAYLENVSADPKLAYKINVLASRFYYARVRFLDNEDEIELHYEKAMRAADVAKEIGLIDLNEEYADAYYYHGLALARWGENKELTAWLSRRQELVLDMKSAQSLKTLSGEDGMSMDSYGTFRVLGMLYYKLPPIFGGSTTKSIEYLRAASDKGSDLALNTLYLVTVLLSGEGADKKEACHILEDLISRDLSTFNADKPVETFEDLAKANSMYSLECK